MGWLHRNLPWLLLALFLATTATLVGTFVVGLLVVFAAMLSGATLSATLGGTAAVLSVVALLVSVDVLFGFALVVTLIRRASFPRSDRLARVFAVVEQVFPPTRALALSRRFGPSVAERRREIKRRYVEGELSEAEFEQQMRILLDRTEFAASEREQSEASWEGEPGADAVDPLSVDPEREAERE